ncbi:Uncharacterized protein Adt_01740 [Abeliophyllum distichum]|uniref:Uncharacterized protein n=1 Tax=Abeliophyllum distichum TaxID=126358 RepID=A0ABD1VTP2_9LAMI
MCKLGFVILGTYKGSETCYLDLVKRETPKASKIKEHGQVRYRQVGQWDSNEKPDPVKTCMVKFYVLLMCELNLGRNTSTTDLKGLEIPHLSKMENLAPFCLQKNLIMLCPVS